MYNNNTLPEKEYIVSVNKRKKDVEESDNESSKRIHRNLKDNPRPVLTPALRRKREQEKPENSIPKAPPNQIHPSIGAQPRITSEKNKEKKLRDQERMHVSSTVEEEMVPLVNNRANNKNGMNLELKELMDNEGNDREKEPKIKRTPRKIQMQSHEEEYNVLEDLNNAKCNITFGQLMDVAPKVRSQVSHGLKLVKNSTKITGTLDNVIATTTLVNNIEHSYVSKRKNIDEDDIAMVDASVDGVPGKLLIDTCSNLSIMTKQFYNKLPNSYEQIGTSRGRIRLATKNDDYSEGIVIRVPLNINGFCLDVDFRIIDKEDPFYDMLINLKTQIDHNLFIHPIINSLCCFESEGTIKMITPINNSMADEDKLICLLRKLSDVDVKKKLKEIEGISPVEYIHNKIFIDTLPQEYSTTIIRLLEENLEIVATSSEELTPSKLAPHTIKLKPNAKPVKQRAYRLSKFKSDILKEELTKLLNKGLIEPSFSEWSSPVVLVPKHNGNWRMCVDYRRVNKLTEKDSYSLPYIDEIFDSLDGAKVFTTMDLYSGYHQILMSEESVDITSFTTKFGNYQFRVMPFGLTGAPATFQREMNRILFPFIGKFVFNFIDDITNILPE